jgi:hypothetical protein
LMRKPRLFHLHSHDAGDHRREHGLRLDHGSPRGLARDGRKEGTEAYSRRMAPGDT